MTTLQPYNNPMTTESTPPGDFDTKSYIDQLLARALAAGASDLHLEPTATGIDVRFRIDGLLQRIEQLPHDAGRAAVLRLMVLAQLLTYRIDIPQEGRIRTTLNNLPLDLRLAIIPVGQGGGGGGTTGGGLRAVVRLPADLTQPRTLDALGLPPNCLAALQSFIHSDSGMLLVTGPAGSGKTTTIYALLQAIAVESPGLSIIALEDPIERLIPGITQIEVTPHGQMTYDRALKSILRQDPQVLMLGEIRDAQTASLAIQATLTGHRLIATLHAGDPATALARLLEMGLEPYQITSSIFGILTQRLVRKKSPPSALTPQSSYAGRTPIAEFAQLTPPVRAAILAKADADTLRKIFHDQPNHATLRAIAQQLIEQSTTDEPEIRRVLGG